MPKLPKIEKAIKPAADSQTIPLQTLIATAFNRAVGNL
jgi:hypothetical protein